MKQLFALFWSFFKIGVFTFGGGYAMIPLIRREMIDRRGWIDEREFLDLLTVAQTAPGPIALNTSVFVGYKMRGYAGAVATALGVVVPSFTIILIIAVYFAGIRHNPVVDAAFRGMRPAVVALILAPVFSLSEGMPRLLLLVSAAAAVAIALGGLSPVYVLVAGAGAGILWELFILHRHRP